MKFKRLHGEAGSGVAPWGPCGRRLQHSAGLSLVHFEEEA